jgi:hypothetical protein
MEDMAELKRLALDYLHPERPVNVDPTLLGRNYFSRPGAEEYDDVLASSVREQILQDMKELKQLAVDYLHPELPVETSDHYATGRNYFTRPAAKLYHDDDEAKERELVLAEAAALNKLAMDYLHPEVPVKTTDPFATGRNFFVRASSMTTEEAAEREDILEDMARLKKLAMDYLHPELPVKTADPTATARNYFDRASASGHKEQIQTEGYPISRATADYHRGYYHYHIDNHIHHDHQEQSDHFEMDEDMSTEFECFRQSLQSIAAPIKHAPIPMEEEEGKLSRSPSSVMLDLFGDEAIM